MFDRLKKLFSKTLKDSGEESSRENNTNSKEELSSTEIIESREPEPPKRTEKTAKARKDENEEIIQEKRLDIQKKTPSSISTQQEEIIRRDEIDDKIRTILLDSDVSFDTTEKIIEDMDTFIRKSKKRVSMDNVKVALRETLKEIMSSESPRFDILNPGKKPYIVLFLGINGTGKTTSIAKLAYYLKNHGKKVVVSASDTFRAGAIEQLTFLCNMIDVPLIKNSAGSDPASVAFDAVQHAAAKNIDYVLIDSAGRMQTNKNLLDEMKKIKRVAKPDITVLVLDAMIGQDAVSQADTFLKEISFDAIILTKLDTDAKGGAVLTMSNEIKKPIIFVGIGQEMDDFIPFTPEWYLDKILP